MVLLMSTLMVCMWCSGMSGRVRNTNVNGAGPSSQGVLQPTPRRQLQRVEAVYDAGRDTSHDDELREQYLADAEAMQKRMRELATESTVVDSAPMVESAPEVAAPLPEPHIFEVQVNNEPHTYTLERQLGRGGMSTVWSATDVKVVKGKMWGEKTIQGPDVAVKVPKDEYEDLPKSIHQYLTDLAKETTLQKSIDSEHVVKILNDRDDDPVVVMESMGDGASLLDKVNKLGAFSEEQAKRVFLQLVEGLQACHEAGVAHRDLHGQNIFCSGDKLSDLNCKIGDFGLSARIPARGYFSDFVGVKEYESPEVAEKTDYEGPPNDIFMLGGTLYMMFTGKHPEFGSTKSRPSMANQPFTELMNGMLKISPGDRMTLAEIKGHPWLTANILRSQPMESVTGVPSDKYCCCKIEKTADSCSKWNGSRFKGRRFFHFDFNDGKGRCCKIESPKGQDGCSGRKKHSIPIWNGCLPDRFV